MCLKFNIFIFNILKNMIDFLRDITEIVLERNLITNFKKMKLRVHLKIFNLWVR